MWTKIFQSLVGWGKIAADWVVSRPHVLRNGFLAVVCCYLLWVAVNIFWYDAKVFLPLCSMGTERTKSYYAKGGSFEQLYANFDNSSLLYVLDRAAGGDLSTDWPTHFATSTRARPGADQNSAGNAQQAVSGPDTDSAAGDQEPAAGNPVDEAGGVTPVPVGNGAFLIRRRALQTLAELYGIAFDGPYVDASNRNSRELSIYLYAKGSTERRELGRQLRDSNNHAPHRVTREYPSVRIVIRSSSSWTNGSHISYQVEIWSSNDDVAPLSSGEPRFLFERQGFSFLPVRPIFVNAEPHEAAEQIVADIERAVDIASTMRVVSPTVSLDGAVGKLSKDERSVQTRLLAGVFEVITSGKGADPDLSATTGSSPVNQVQDPGFSKQTLGSRLRSCRLFNGVNNAGLINFCVLVFVVWGIMHLVTADKDEMDDITEQTEGLIAVLPMLGFAGTLYGMLLAFGSAGLGGGGAELISFIGISLDTTIVAVVGAIVLSLVLMWKVRRVASSA